MTYRVFNNIDHLNTIQQKAQRQSGRQRTFLIGQFDWYFAKIFKLSTRRNAWKIFIENAQPLKHIDGRRWPSQKGSMELRQARNRNKIKNERPENAIPAPLCFHTTCVICSKRIERTTIGVLFGRAEPDLLWRVTRQVAEIYWRIFGEHLLPTLGRFQRFKWQAKTPTQLELFVPLASCPLL